MKKEKFIISTIILIIGGAITKILGMLIKIIMTRIVGQEGISLYMLVFPTFMLFMTISQLGFPTAISKLIADDNHNNKNMVFSIIPFSLLFNILLMIIIIIFAPIIANSFLKDSRLLYPILAIAIVLPFDSISSILRGFFFGKQQMLPHTISHIFEQIIRMLIIIFFIPTLLDKSIVYAIVGLILVNAISELASIIIMLFFIPRKNEIRFADIKPSMTNIKDVLSIAIPTTGVRVVGSIGYFLEPIILTLALTKVGYDTGFITNQYGIIEGYVFPLLLLPGFFTNAISNALLPVISNSYAHGKINDVKRKIKQAIIISLMIGLPITIILMINPQFFLKAIYNTEHGATYLRTIAPFFLLLYIQAPLVSVLQSVNKAGKIMNDNIIAAIVKLSVIYILSTFKIGLYPLIIATAIDIILVTFLHYAHVKRALAT